MNQALHDELELQTTIQDCNQRLEAIDLRGNGSWSCLHHPKTQRASQALDLRHISGIVDYQPEELIVVVRANTPLTELENLLAAQGQQLAFEPRRPNRLLGTSGGSVAGAVLVDFAGPRRPTVGSARDHLLGGRAISGKGEVFNFGSRMVKNVTGFDISKLVAGSMGCLAASTEFCLRALPAPEACLAIVLDCSCHDAERYMVAAMQGFYAITGASFISASLCPADWNIKKDGALTFRFEGRDASLKSQLDSAITHLAMVGDIQLLDQSRAINLWTKIRDLDFLPSHDRSAQSNGGLGNGGLGNGSPASDGDELKQNEIWTIFGPPAQWNQLLRSIADELSQQKRAPLANFMLDWAGGQLWLSYPTSTLEDSIAHRSFTLGSCLDKVATANGALAKLVKSANPACRAEFPILRYKSQTELRINQNIKNTFDPSGILNAGQLSSRVIAPPFETRNIKSDHLA